MEPRDPAKRAPGAEPTLPLPEGLATGLDLDRPALPFVDPARWTIRREMARGGMGRILEAQDHALGRTVALKQALSRDVEIVRRFEREALVTARLQHPGVVPIYDAGRAPGGEPFFVMRLVEGRSLEAALDEARTFPARLALLPALAAVADTIAYAHSRGIVHRDLKPANVLVGSYGDVVVIDWGLAKVTGSHASLPGIDSTSALATSSGSVLGTPSFMAPEQARGADVDARTDVFALGAMLFTLLAGRPPYLGASSLEVIEAVLRGPPPALRGLVPDVHADLVAIAEKAMAREPADRYPSAEELARDLRRFTTGQLVGARRYTRAERALRWALAHRTVLALAAAIGIAALLATVNVVRARNAVRVEAERLQESGRRALLEGRRTRAALDLARAARLEPGDATTRLLLGEAMKTVRQHRSGGRVHTGKVDVVLADPTRTRLATGGEDGRVILWSISTGLPIAETRAHEQPITWLDFSPDGSRVASSSYDRTAALLDAHTGEVRARLEGHEAPLNIVVFSPDGSRLATTDDTGSVRLWDASGRLLRELPAHEGRAWSAAFVDATRLATVDGGGTLRLFDADTGRLLARQTLHEGDVKHVTVSPDRTVLATAGEDGARLWTREGEPLAHLDHPELWDVQFSPDGRGVVTTGALREAIVWEVPTGRRLFTCSNGSTRAEVNWSRFSPDGSRLATANADGTVRVCSLDGRELAVFDGHGWNAFRVEWAAEGSGLITGGHDGTVRFWATPRSGESVRFPSRRAFHASWSPDGTRVATCDEDGAVTLWPAEGGAPLRRFEDPARAATLVRWSPDGRHLLATYGAEGARVWDLESGRVLHDVEARSESAADFHGTRFYTAAAGGRLVWRDVETGAVTDERAFEMRDVFAAAVSPDGGTTIVASVDGTLEANGGRRLPSVHEGEITWITFDAAGERFATAGFGDGTIVLWDRATLEPRQRIPAFYATYASFSPDGRLLATVGRHGVDVWELETGRPLLHFDAHRPNLYSVEFSRDGSRLLTAGTEGARVWLLAPASDPLDEVDRLLEPFRVTEEGPGSLRGSRGF